MKIIGKALVTGFELGLVWMFGALTAELTRKCVDLKKENEELEEKYANTCMSLDNMEKRNANLRKQVSTMQSRFDRARNLIG